MSESDEIADGINGVYADGYTIPDFETARFLVKRWMPRDETQTVIDNAAQALWERHGKH